MPLSILPAWSKSWRHTWHMGGSTTAGDILQYLVVHVCVHSPESLQIGLLFSKTKGEQPRRNQPSSSGSPEPSKAPSELPDLSLAWKQAALAYCGHSKCIQDLSSMLFKFSYLSSSQWKHRRQCSWDHRPNRIGNNTIVAEHRDNRHPFGWRATQPHSPSCNCQHQHIGGCMSSPRRHHCDSRYTHHRPHQSRQHHIFARLYTQFSLWVNG